MKNVTFKALIVCLSLIAVSCSVKNANTETFKVWGNCGMCKKTIESSLEYDGIVKADWNVDSKIMSVKYDTTKTNLDEILKHIAGAGYDTEKYPGDSTAYTKLDECCQYERKK